MVRYVWWSLPQSVCCLVTRSTFERWFSSHSKCTSTNIGETYRSPSDRSGTCDGSRMAILGHQRNDDGAKKIYIFIFEINRNILRPLRCRAARVFLQKFSQRICAKAPGRPVARQRGGRPPLHYLRVGCPQPLVCITKIPEKRKVREGGREAKPSRIFKPVTAGNQNSSTLYKQFML